jgi:hypothetical protein
VGAGKRRAPADPVRQQDADALAGVEAERGELPGQPGRRTAIMP